MTAAGERPFRPWMAWAGLAVMLGILAGRVPVMIAGGGLVMVGIGLAILAEPALGLLVMLGLGPLKTLIATESPLALPVDIGQMSFAAVVGAWAVTRAARERTAPLPRTRVMLPLLAIMLGFSPSLFAARSTGAWISEMLKWVEMLLLVAIVLDLRSRWTWIAFGAVLAAVLQALIGLYEFRGGSGAPHLWLANHINFRAFGTFGQPNPFSAFMGLTLPLSLGLAWGYVVRAARNWYRGMPVRQWIDSAALAVMYAGFGAILFAGLIASWGRGAWMGFGAAALGMVFFLPRKRWQGGVLLVLGGALVALLWLTGYVPVGVQQRITNTVTDFTGFGDMRAVPISDENFAIVERLAHWQAAYYMASDHPFIGVGLGNYEVAYPQYGLPSWPRALGHAHNDYLNVLAETGMVGLAVYLVGWAVIVYWTLRALDQPDPVMRGLVLGLLGTWIHLAVHSVVDKLYVNNLFLHIGVMLGLLAGAYHYHQQLLEGHEDVDN